VTEVSDVLKEVESMVRVVLMAADAVEPSFARAHSFMLTSIDTLTGEAKEDEEVPRHAGHSPGAAASGTDGALCQGATQPSTPSRLCVCTKSKLAAHLVLPLRSLLHFRRGTR
jgi:hypothetical protein